MLYNNSDKEIFQKLLDSDYSKDYYKGMIDDLLNQNIKNVEIIQEKQRIKSDLQAKKIAEEISKNQLKHDMPSLLDGVIMALAKFQGNSMYNSSLSEDDMNDYVRDILSTIFETKDQTRQGYSNAYRVPPKKRGAGELDIQINYNGKIVGIYEGLKIERVNKQYVYDHITKAMINYNPQGVKNVFVVSYVINHFFDFGDFWCHFIETVRDYKAPNPGYQVTWENESTDSGYSKIKALHGLYFSDGEEHDIWIIAVCVKN
ncbi:MAG: hypothetical protein PUG68_09460 [Lachnospiraceae bacterium]|nr:hypothetical protein [Lachnospiraceae bacterium]MDY2759940.1 hypothetical protein [Lachnospiraceae bacterium]